MISIKERMGAKMFLGSADLRFRSMVEVSVTKSTFLVAYRVYCRTCSMSVYYHHIVDEECLWK